MSSTTEAKKTLKITGDGHGNFHDFVRVTDENGEQVLVIKEARITLNATCMYADIDVIGYAPPPHRNQVPPLVANTTYLDLDLKNIVVRSVNVETAYSSAWNQDERRRLKLNQHDCN